MQRLRSLGRSTRLGLFLLLAAGLLTNITLPHAHAAPAPGSQTIAAYASEAGHHRDHHAPTRHDHADCLLCHHGAPATLAAAEAWSAPPRLTAALAPAALPLRLGASIADYWPPLRAPPMTA